MFIESLFTRTKTWKEPKYLSRDNWINKMWYTMQWNITSAIRSNRNNTICSDMYRPRDGNTKWSKPDRERQISYDRATRRNLKNYISRAKELIYKIEYTDIEKNSYGH